MTTATTEPGRCAELMTDAEAAWIREHVWTQLMRNRYEISREDGKKSDWIFCDCQLGPTAECRGGDHEACGRKRNPWPPRWETVIELGGWAVAMAEPFEHETRCPPYNRLMRIPLVWLADRACRWRCPCDCHNHHGAGPGQQASLFAEVR